MRDRAEDADGDPSVAVPAVVASNFGVVMSSGSHSGTEQRPVVDTTGISHPLLVRGSLLLAAWTLSGDDMKTEAFRKEWSNYIGQQSRSHISYLQKCLERLVPLER